MGGLFHIEVITPSEIAFEGDIESLVAPSSLGYLGVLANHAPFAADLGRGKIVLKGKQNMVKVFDCAGKGFIQVLNNRATVISDAIAPCASPP